MTRKGQGGTLPFAIEPRNLGTVLRCSLLLLPVLLLWSGETPTSFVFVETVAGKPSPGSDRAMIEGLAKQHRERLTRARAELPTATPAIARLIRADLGALEAELERLAVVGGGTLTVGRRTYIVQPDLIAVESDGTRLEVDPATGRGRSIASPGAEPTAVAMAPAPAQVPLDRGEAGPLIIERPTRRFTISADGRDYTVLIDPTLTNPFARLIPIDREDAAVTLELAKLPGMPLDIAFDSGDFVRRFTCVEVR
jgi:hypothetical protein